MPRLPRPARHCIDCGGVLSRGDSRCAACWAAILKGISGTRDIAYTAAGAALGLPAGPDAMAEWWKQHEHLSHAAAAEALGVGNKWVRTNRPVRERAGHAARGIAPGTKRAPAPPKPTPDLPCPGPDRVTRLARAIARDPRPDEEKINERLTLLKMVKRRFDRKRGA